jgi:hypothetical protein
MLYSPAAGGRIQRHHTHGQSISPLNQRLPKRILSQIDAENSIAPLRGKTRPAARSLKQHAFLYRTVKKAKKMVAEKQILHSFR